MRRVLLFLGPVIACAACGSSKSSVSQTTIGARYTLAVAQDLSSIVLSRDGAPLLTLPSDGIELGVLDDGVNDSQSYDPYPLEYTSTGEAPDPPDDLAWQTITSASAVSSGNNAVSANLSFGNISATLSIKEAETGSFTLLLTPNDVNSSVAYVRFRARTTGDAKEGFYGLGEWEDSVDHRGKLRPMQIEADSNSESSYNEDHVPVPLLIGTHGWGVFAESKRVGLFDVARKEPDLVEITYGTGTSTSQGFTLHLYATSAPLDVLKLYYDSTAFPRLPATWAIGPLIWRNGNESQAQVLTDIQTIRTLDLATSGIWIDNPYATKIGSFDFNPASYTDPATMIRAANAVGLRVAAWHVPYVESGATPEAAEVAAGGYLPPQNSLIFNPWGPPIDFTNPAALSYWTDHLKRYTALGVEGFKLDYGEDVAPSLLGDRNIWKFADGSDERTMHYGYTVLYHSTYQSVLADAAFLLCRTGRWGDQANVSIVWPGDMDASFVKHGDTFTTAGGQTIANAVGGLPATVIMGLSLGASGFPFFAADTGGYRHSPPQAELYERWFEQTSLSAAMEVGDSSSETPWEFEADNGRTQATLDDYRIYARLHMRLFPYEWSLASAMRATGRPITRAFGLEFPAIGAHPDDEYTFGDDLLVAPVITEGATTRDLIVPPGDWIGWWDGGVISGGPSGGGTTTVPAPLGTLPLFLRAGGAIAMLRPTIDTLAPVSDPTAIESFGNDPGILFFRAAPRANADVHALVYDGSSLAIAHQTDGSEQIVIGDGALFQKGDVLELIATSAPQSVSLGGNALPAAASEAELFAASDARYFWEGITGGTLWIRVPRGSGAITVR